VNTIQVLGSEDKRLQKTKETLEEGVLKASDIYLDFGYNNLSTLVLPFKTNSEKSKRN
jgi:AraC-like DNA-binding protein